MEYVLKEKADGSIITVRDVQLTLLEMMKDIDKICRENNIEYVLTGGSTLGAVKYQGFIPWDDDIDIAMRRSEYNKFVKVLKEKLPDQYVCHCYETNRRYNVAGPAMKIRKKGTYLKEVNTLLANKCDDCDGIFIDVFIYDYLSNHLLLDLPLRTINTILMPIIVFFENIHLNPIPLKALFRWNARIYGRLCHRSKYIGDEITWVFRSPTMPLKYVYDEMFPVHYVKFEDTELPVQKNEKEYCRRRYGEQWKFPLDVKKQKPKHVVDISLTSAFPEESSNHEKK